VSSTVLLRQSAWIATIALGDGVVDIRAVVKALRDIGFTGATTLEVAGVENVKRSLKKLYEWSGL
jgi:sugar phosphate isomerase/epimerase